LQLSAAAQASMVTIYAAYLVNPSYSGPVFNLRRSSDNAMADFYADALGNLGTEPGAMGTSVVEWVGVGQVSIAFVSTWYDQSGQANHATQSNEGSQPEYSIGGQNVDFSGTNWLTTTKSSFLLGNEEKWIWI
jgi:hypothetical protein